LRPVASLNALKDYLSIVRIVCPGSEVHGGIMRPDTGEEVAPRWPVEHRKGLRRLAVVDACGVYWLAGIVAGRHLERRR
jgi:hypothetical protein